MSAPQGPPAPLEGPSGPQPYGPSSAVGPPKPPRVTEGPEIGLPPGVALAELGPRVAAYVIDASVPIVLNLILLLVGAARGQSAPAALSVVFAVLMVGWFVFVWWGYATKAAGPGAQVMKLQLVGMSDGRPVGWGRYLVRALIFGLALVFFPVLIALLVVLTRNPRRQGWHDLAVGSVEIKARALAPRPAKPGATSTGAPAVGPSGDAEPTVGIPASSVTPPSSYGAPGSAGPPPSGAHYGPVSRGLGAGRTSSQPSAAARAQEDDAVDATPPARFVPAPGQPYDGPPPAPSQPQSPPIQPSGGPAPDAPAPYQPQSPLVQPSGGPAPDAPAPSPSPDSPVESGAWQLRLDGKEITVERLVLLGRNPQRGPGEEDAEIVKVKDEARTVSKTHVAIGVDEQGLFAVDRGSTNGSAVTGPDGSYRLLQPGDPVRIDAGWVVAFGQHELTVSRAG